MTKIIIDLGEASEEEAQGVFNEIKDKMFPDYDDCVVSVKIED